MAARVPEGAIAFVVRPDDPERATRVTHAGIVARGPGGALLVRHATSSKGVGRVIEEPIERFLRREARAYARWPLEGLAFFEVRDNAARVRAMVARGARSSACPAARAAAPPPPPGRPQGRACGGARPGSPVPRRG
jgi:hypothetical protein